MRHILGFLASLTILLTPFAVTPTPAQAENCQFVLGFKTLHDLIPDVVGNCLVNEHFNPANGDSLQETTGTRTNGGVGGLLVWRKADNFTAFTDGFRTWVNGPFGLQERLNSQRFFWEQNPEMLAIIPPRVPGDRCHTAGLSLSLQGSEGAAGHIFNTFRFTDNLAAPCTFFGFVGAQMLDAQSNPLPTQVIRGGGMLSNEPGPTLFTVPPGGSAIFKLEWSDVPSGNETTCPAASRLAVTPPDEFDPIIIPMELAPCGGGTLHVTAVQPPSS